MSMLLDLGTILSEFSDKIPPGRCETWNRGTTSRYHPRSIPDARYSTSSLSSEDDNESIK